MFDLAISVLVIYLLLEGIKYLQDRGSKKD